MESKSIHNRARMKLLLLAAYRFDMSSSSPPHPQNEFEKPFTVRNCFTVMAETPPKMELYGNLEVNANVMNGNENKLIYIRLSERVFAVVLEAHRVNGN